MYRGQVTPSISLEKYHHTGNSSCTIQVVLMCNCRLKVVGYSWNCEHSLHLLSCHFFGHVIAHCLLYLSVSQLIAGFWLLSFCCINLWQYLSLVGGYVFIESSTGGALFPAWGPCPNVGNLGWWQLLKCDTLVFFICFEVEHDCGISPVLFAEVTKTNTPPKSITYKCLPITKDCLSPWRMGLGAFSGATTY